MSEVSRRDSADILECPRCQSPMVEREAPFYLHGEYVGSFESLVCDMCHYSLLTSYGYDEAMIEASKFGLVGPQEEIIKETVEMSDASYAFEDLDLVMYSDYFNQSQEFRGSGKEITSDSITSVVRIIIPNTHGKQQPVRRTESLVH